MRDRSMLESVVIPERGFLREYYDYACPLTEAPELPHLFAGLAVLSATCGRNLFIPYGSYTLYPNLWIIIVAPSSRCKKTTIINMGAKILREHDPTLIYPAEFSMEAIMSTLSERPQGLFLWSEFGATLEHFNRPYMAGAKETFTTLYDNPDHYERKLKKESIEVEYPCISILSASTVDWLRSKLTETDIMSGFLARFIYILTDGISKKLPVPPPPNPAQRNNLVNKLESISRHASKVTMTKEAQLFYETWYNEQRDELIKSPQPTRVDPFLSRLENYILKFAMLYQIAEDYNTEIQLNNMELAKHLTTLLTVNIKEFVTGELAFSREAQDSQRVIDVLKKHNGVLTRSELVREFRDGAKRLDETLRTVMEGGQVQLSLGDDKRTKIYSLV